MTKIITVTLLLLGIASISAAEMYKLENVKRLDSDVVQG